MSVCSVFMLHKSKTLTIIQKISIKETLPVAMQLASSASTWALFE